MSKVEEARALAMQASGYGRNSCGAMAQAQAELEQMRSALLAAVEGSAQDDVAGLLAEIAQMIEQLSQMQGGVSQGCDQTEQVAARL